MNKLILIPVIVGIAIVVSISFLFVDDDPTTFPSIYETGFTYYDIEIIQNILAEQNIIVSKPSAITDHTISEYCTFYENGILKTVKYCTTTAVLDSKGNPLGNINIGGDIQSPIMAVANLETSTLESNRDDVFAIFETMIETLVCDCWDAKQSEDYESISSWLEAAHTFYSDSGKKNIKSKIDNLGDSEIFLEITSKDNSILQTLIILK
jgi:hypothetical protein